MSRHADADGAGEHRQIRTPAHVQPIRSGKAPYVGFDLNDYTIPHTLVRKPLTLSADERAVRVLDGTLEVANHVRSYDRGQRVEEKAHLDGLLAERRHALPTKTQDRLRAAIPEIDRLYEMLALRGENLGTNVARFASLLSLYGVDDLREAIHEAVVRETPRSSSVGNIVERLHHARNAPAVLPVRLPDNPRVRDLRVVSHDPATYAESLDDLVAQATKGRWGPRELVEIVVQREIEEQQRRSTERRARDAHIGRFKTMDQFDWAWPATIDRDQIERLLALDWIGRADNWILAAAQGLGKTMLAKNVAHRAVLAGHSVLVTTAAAMLLDLRQQDSARALQARLRRYTSPRLLILDGVGYLSYDAASAAILFDVASRRYESGAILLTTNLAFTDWPQHFTGAACVTAMIDRLTHHGEVVAIEGKSYRLKEAQENRARRGSKT